MSWFKPRGASVTTSLAEQRAAGRAARKVGGYSELVRLSGDASRIRRVGGRPVLVRDPDGHYRYEDELGKFKFDVEYPRHIYFENGWWWVRGNSGEQQFATRDDAVRNLKEG